MERKRKLSHEDDTAKLTRWLKFKDVTLARPAATQTRESLELGKFKDVTLGHPAATQTRESLESFTHPLLSIFRTQTLKDRLLSRENMIRIREPAYTGLILEQLACAYENALEKFCNGIVTPASATTLKLEPVSVLVGDAGALVQCWPELSWSGIALALARLGPPQHARLQSASIQMLVDLPHADEFNLMLIKKIRASKVQFCVESGNACLPLRDKSYEWIRSSNDAEARFHRLQSFMLTQRIVYAGSFRNAPAKGKEIVLENVHKMLTGTKLHWEKKTEEASSASKMAERKLSLCTPFELGWQEQPEPTAIELAHALATQGRPVVAVNAASAYHVGGGVGSGGRHALEEAWCTASTLYTSLRSIGKQSTSVGCIGQRRAELHQHIPSSACIVSPGVEIFRGPTATGYELLNEPSCLCGIVSVAMFNRNPAIKDSPLDSPDDPATYISKCRKKLQNIVTAAISLGAEILVIPSLGCGVFHNDPVVIGGCLGEVLAGQAQIGVLEEVVLMGDPAFIAACRRTFEGKDPRELCPDDGHCARREDVNHMARLLHTEVVTDKTTSFEAVYHGFVTHPKVRTMPPCRYGASCRMKNEEHFVNFSHPEKRSGGSSSSLG